MLVTVFLFISCSENKATDSKNVAKQENLAKLVSNEQAKVQVDNKDDVRFLMDAAEMQLGEISLGQLAQQKNSSASVSKLGKMMEDDYTKSLTELKALSQLKSISTPASITNKSKYTYEKLSGKSGSNFGKAYCNLMVKHHGDAIELFENVSKYSEDSEIKDWASKKILGLISHLKHAQECQNETYKL